MFPAQPGFPETLKPSFPMSHTYDVLRPLGQAGLQCVLDKFKNNPTPGDARPATPEGTLNNAVVKYVTDSNWVTSILTTNLRTGAPLVVNVTGLGSTFGPGYVARTVTNGVAHTYGEGSSWIQSYFVPSMVRAIANESLWGSQMQQFIAECNCK